MSPKMNCLINFSSRQWVSLCSVYTASNINQKNYAGIEKVDQIPSWKHCSQIFSGCSTGSY